MLRKIIYLASLLVLGGLLTALVVSLMTSGARSSEVQREQLIEGDDGWILQFDIVNRDAVPAEYDISVTLDGQAVGGDGVSIIGGGKYSYIYHLQRSRLPSGVGELGFRVFKNSAPEPVENGTFFLK